MSGSGPNGSASGVSPGFLAGGQVGYNYQFPNSHFVVGIEGDLDWANFNISSPTSGGKITIDNTYIATIGGRLGYSLEHLSLFGLALNPILVFGKAGWAWTNEEWNITSNKALATNTFDRDGWMLGAGAEYALWRNWSIKAEYNYYSLGTIHEVLFRKNGANVILGNVNAFVHLGKAGINYRF